MAGEPKDPRQPFAPRFKNLPVESVAGPGASPVASGNSDEVAGSRIGSSKRQTPLFLDLRKKDGTHKALSYAYLVAIDYDTKGITLEFTGYRVSLTGRNLDDLFRRLVAEVIGQVREVDVMTDKATGDPKKSVVYSIEWVKV